MSIIGTSNADDATWIMKPIKYEKIHNFYDSLKHIKPYQAFSLKIALNELDFILELNDSQLFFIGYKIRRKR